MLSLLLLLLLMLTDVVVDYVHVIVAGVDVADVGCVVIVVNDIVGVIIRFGIAVVTFIVGVVGVDVDVFVVLLLMMSLFNMTMPLFVALLFLSVV